MLNIKQSTHTFNAAVSCNNVCIHINYNVAKLISKSKMGKIKKKKLEAALTFRINYERRFLLFL